MNDIDILCEFYINKVLNTKKHINLSRLSIKTFEKFIYIEGILKEFVEETANRKIDLTIDTLEKDNLIMLLFNKINNKTSDVEICNKTILKYASHMLSSKFCWAEPPFNPSEGELDNLIYLCQYVFTGHEFFNNLVDLSKLTTDTLLKLMPIYDISPENDIMKRGEIMRLKIKDELIDERKIKYFRYKTEEDFRICKNRIVKQIEYVLKAFNNIKEYLDQSYFDEKFTEDIVTPNMHLITQFKKNSEIAENLSNKLLTILCLDEKGSSVSGKEIIELIAKHHLKPQKIYENFKYNYTLCGGET